MNRSTLFVLLGLTMVGITSWAGTYSWNAMNSPSGSCSSCGLVAMPTTASCCPLAPCTEDTTVATEGSCQAEADCCGPDEPCCLLGLPCCEGKACCEGKGCCEETAVKAPKAANGGCCASKK